MSRPLIRIHNTETNEIIDREMNDDELAQYEADQAAELKRQNEIKARAKVKAALYERLGITEEEAKILLG